MSMVVHARLTLSYITLKNGADCLVIESKWQASGGSIDEKYPFEVQTINLNQYPTLIVLDGEGYKDEAGKWLKGHAGKGNILHVVDQGEFARLASSGFFS